MIALIVKRSIVDDTFQFAFMYNNKHDPFSPGLITHCLSHGAFIMLAISFSGMIINNDPKMFKAGLHNYCVMVFALVLDMFRAVPYAQS